MYVLPYIFIGQLSSAADSENGRKYEVRCSGGPVAYGGCVRDRTDRD